MTYTPRTTTPSSGDKRWTVPSYGGYNNCIIGSPTAWGGSVLANCTGYVHGRWMELGNTNTDYNLSLGNAKEYWGHNDGYARGQEPQLGAILCMSGANIGSSNAGHVAIVEEIFGNGDIMVSESNYGSEIFGYRRRYKATGYRRQGGSVGGFQGFIYHPNINPPTPVEPTYTLTVKGGTASSTTGKSGDRVVITADVPTGYRFIKWVISGKGSVDYENQAHTTFTFGDGDCTLTAIIAKMSSSSKLKLMYYINNIPLKSRY